MDRDGPPTPATRRSRDGQGVPEDRRRVSRILPIGPSPATVSSGFLCAGYGRSRSARIWIALPPRGVWSGPCLHDARCSARCSGTYPLDRVGLQSCDTIEKVSDAVPRCDLACHLAHAPVVVLECTSEGSDVVAGSRPQQPSRSPHAKPVRLVIQLTVVEIADRRRSPKGDDEVGVRSTTGEQHAAAPNDFGPAKPDAGSLHSNSGRRHVRQSTNASPRLPSTAGCASAGSAWQGAATTMMA